MLLLRSFRLLLFGSLLGLLCSCENSIKDINRFGSRNKNLQVEQAIDINTYMSQGGTMKAHLTAPLMNNYHTDTPYFEFPNRLHVDFYKDSTLLIESVVDAKYSRYFPNEQKILLRDSVVIHNLITGDSLKTNEMWWDQRQALFYGSKAVKMFMKNAQDLDGIGYTIKQDFSKYTLDSNTIGTMRVPGDMGLQ